MGTLAGGKPPGRHAPGRLVLRWVSWFLPPIGDRRKASIKRAATYEYGMRNLQGTRQTANFCPDLCMLSKLATALFGVLHPLAKCCPVRNCKRCTVLVVQPSPRAHSEHVRCIVWGQTALTRENWPFFLLYARRHGRRYAKLAWVEANVNRIESTRRLVPPLPGETETSLARPTSHNCRSSWLPYGQRAYPATESSGAMACTCQHRLDFGFPGHLQSFLPCGFCEVRREEDAADPREMASRQR